MGKIVLQNITFKPDGTTPQLSGEELKELCELGITISDTETTGLQRGKAGLNEFASIRAVKAAPDEPNIDGYKLELFHCFVLPFRPEYQSYLRAKEQAEQTGEPLPEYSREQYEYDIAPAALAVTGTQFMRQSLDGPLTGMKVLGEKVEAHTFYEVWDEIQAFTNHGRGDVYYNTPFDKPFLDALSDELKEYSNEPQTVDNEDAYKNSSLYQCLLFNYMQAGGIDASNRLDDAYRKLVNPDFTEREEHSGIEDILMAAQVACKIAENRKADGLPAVPTMQELYALLVHKIDPDASVRLLPPRIKGKEEKVLGDIEIQFSKSPKALGPEAERLWLFLSGFEEVTKLNSHVPKHLLECDEAQHKVTINAERKQPLSLSFLKKWMLFDQLQDHPSIEGFYPFDSTGTRVDILLKEDTKQGPENSLIHDVSLGSLRANQQFLRDHPELTVACLHLVQKIRRLDKSIGTVLVRKDAETGAFRISISGHQRNFGNVTFTLPSGMRLEEAEGLITQKMEPLLKLGVIPHMQGLEYNEEEALQDTKRNSENRDRIDASLDATGDAIQLKVSPLILQMIAMQIGKSPQHIHQLKHIPTRSGAINIKRHSDPHTGEDSYCLSGSMEAFWDFSILESQETGKEDAELSGKPSSIIRNASWIISRLEKLPGTYGVKLKGKMLVIEQKDGVSLEALNLLQRLELLPFKAYKDHIKIDAELLMQDAFSWSQALSRLEEDREAERKRPIDKQQLRARQSVVNAHRGLLKGQIQALEVDDLGTCWALDGSKDVRAEGADNHYPLSGLEKPFVTRGKKHIDPLYSPVRGKFHLDAEETPEATYLELSNEVYALWQARCKAHHQTDTSVELDEKRDRSVVLRIEHNAQGEAARKHIEEAANAVLQLSRLTGVARIPIDAHDMEVTPDGLNLRMPDLGLFSSLEYMLSNLIEFHASLVRQETDEVMRSLRQNLPKPAEVNFREGNLFLLCERMRNIADQIDTLDEALENTQRKSTYVNYSGGKRSQGKMLATLQTLGSLIHEASSDLARLKGPEDAPQSPAFLALEKSLDAISMVREKLFRLHTANLRLDEQIGVLRKALSDHGKNGASSLRGAINETLVFLIDQYALEIDRQIETDGDHEARYQSFKSTMDKTFSQALDGLLSRDTAETKDVEPNISGMCKMRAYEVLQHLAVADADTSESLERVARYVLEKGFPEWSLAQIHAVIALYQGQDITETQLEEAGFTHGKAEQAQSIEGVLQRHLMMQDRDLSSRATRGLDEAEKEGINKAIASAFEKRANAYLYLMHEAYLDAEEGVESSDFSHYKQRAATCLQKAHWSDAEIEARITKVMNRQHPYSSSTYSDARNRIDSKPSLDSQKLDKHLRVIDQPEHEARARAMLEASAMRKKQQFYGRIEQDLPEPYATYKQHKELLSAAVKCGEEIEDLALIKYHMAHDLSAVITLLLNEPSMATSLREDMMQAITPIMKSLEGTPQEAGIYDEVEGRDAIAESHHYRGNLSAEMDSKLLRALEVAGIAHSFHKDTEPHWVHIPMRELVKWADVCAAPEADIEPVTQTASAQVSLPELQPLPRRDTQNALRYAQSLFGSLSIGARGKSPSLSFSSTYPNTQRKGFACSIALTLNDHGTPEPYNRFVPAIMNAFATSPWGAHCTYTQSQKEETLTFDYELIPALSCLVIAARSLGKLDAVKDITVDPKTLDIQCSVELPSGRAARDRLKGKLQYATQGILPVKLSGYTALDSGKAGEIKNMSLQISPSILGGEVPQPHPITAEEARDLFGYALRAEGIPREKRNTIRDGLERTTPQSFRERLKNGLRKDRKAIDAIDDALNGERANSR